ncbi:PsiF family protein [Arboricoccus pini]|uniref:PsiF family protein n=1 Tax=Arboricoccus pini TaxID=1963835 RepID=UPI000B4FF771
MRGLLVSAMLVAAALCTNLPGVAHALEPENPIMSRCSADAETKGLSGDARINFLSRCFSANDTAAATSTTSDASKKCAADADAKKLHGASRRSFVKKCRG